MIARLMLACLTLTCLTLAAATPAAAQVGRVFPSETRTIVDRTTGRTITALTSGAYADLKIYQTHPQWAADGTHIIFRSMDRAGANNPQIFAVDEISGAIVQLTDGPGTGTGSPNVARLSNKLYYMRRPVEGGGDRYRLIEVDLTPLLADAKAGTLRPGGYERVVATLPDGHIEAGGFTLDADERTAYTGFDARPAPPRAPGGPVQQVPGGIRAIDLATGRVRTVITTPFRMGHVQANPFVPGEILYCHETGGDAPQRMFIVKADGTGNRPVYPEQPWEWVTHEQFADADHVIFNLMGHRPALRQHHTGIVIVSLRDGSVTNIGQIDGGTSARTGVPYFNQPDHRPDPDNVGGYWHNAVTYDGRLAAGDDFDGNLHLIDRATGKRTLLSTGHRMRPDHIHPSFSPDNSRILINSGMLADGKRLALMTVPVGDPAR